MMLITEKSISNISGASMTDSLDYGSTIDGIRLDREVEKRIDDRVAEQKGEPAPARKPKAKELTNSREQFTGANIPYQVKVPEDLVQSLKLHAIQSGKTMSQLVVECLTSKDFIAKAWVSTRREAS